MQVPAFVVQNVAPLIRRLAESAAETGAITNAAADGAKPATGGSRTGGGGGNSNAVTTGSAAFSARDARSRVVTGVMLAELHRMLLKRSAREVQAVVALLEATTKLAEERSAAVGAESGDVKERLGAASGALQPLQRRLRRQQGGDLRRLRQHPAVALVRRARRVGPGGPANPVITFQIPETALSLALATASRRLGRWCQSRNAAAQLNACALLGAQQRRLSTLEGEIARLETQRELDQKMVARRVQASITDQHFSLLLSSTTCPRRSARCSTG